MPNMYKETNMKLKTQIEYILWNQNTNALLTLL